MSYCRWSSDDWQSDVYAYEDCGGWFQIHVAGRRRVPRVPFPPPVSLDDDSDDALDRFLKRQAEVNEIINGKPKTTTGDDGMEYVASGYKVEPQSDWLDLEGEHAGRSYRCATLGGFLDKLTEIRDSGLNVPEGALEAVREEIADRGRDYEPEDQR